MGGSLDLLYFQGDDSLMLFKFIWRETKRERPNEVSVVLATSPSPFAIRFSRQLPNSF